MAKEEKILIQNIEPIPFESELITIKSIKISKRNGEI